MKIAENNCAPVEQCVSRSTLATVSATPKNLAPLDKSNPIKDLQQLSREHAARCAAIARKTFQRAILPIYGEFRNRLTHIRTCTLLEIDGVKLFVTAAHVIDNHRQSVLYTDGAGKIMPISGDFKSTNAPDGKRSLDHYDFSVCPITPEFAAQLGDVTYIGNASISAGRRASDDPSAYLAMGYPNSRNKNIDMAARIVNVRFWNFTSFAKPNREMSAVGTRFATSPFSSIGSEARRKTRRQTGKRHQSGRCQRRPRLLRR